MTTSIPFFLLGCFRRKEPFGSRMWALADSVYARTRARLCKIALIAPAIG